MDDRTNGRSRTIYLDETFVRAAIEEDIDVALDRLRARIAGAISEADADSARVLTVLRKS